MTVPRRFLLIALVVGLGFTDAGLSAQDTPVNDPDPRRFAAQIEKFADEDAKSPPKDGVTVFVGSSSIRLWNLSKCFADLNAINRGFGGSQISDVNHFARKVVLKYRPKKVVFFCGGNDIASGKPPAQVFEDFQAFTQLLFRELPRTELIVLAIKPSPARRQFLDKVRAANALIREDTKKDARIRFLDGAFDLLVDEKGEIREELFVEDRIHMNEEGYRLWTEMLRPYLKERS